MLVIPRTWAGRWMVHTPSGPVENDLMVATCFSRRFGVGYRLSVGVL